MPAKPVRIHEKPVEKVTYRKSCALECGLSGRQHPYSERHFEAMHGKFGTSRSQVCPSHSQQLSKTHFVSTSRIEETELTLWSHHLGKLCHQTHRRSWVHWVRCAQRVRISYGVERRTALDRQSLGHTNMASDLYKNISADDLVLKHRIAMRRKDEWVSTAVTAAQYILAAQNIGPGISASGWPFLAYMTCPT